MADHVLETKILLRYGTYAEWMNSDIILEVGEAAICAFPNNRTIESLSNNRPENTPPAIGIKIGDGESYFYELPWVQAIAADVYTWAKSASKPTYTAQEIQGLQAYIEQYAPGGGGSGGGTTVAPRAYQLVQGTDEDENKYYLRYKDADSDVWIIDTSVAIDLQDLVDVVNWLGRSNIEDYPNLISRNAEQIRYFIGQLNAADEARDNQFVTAVSEEAGIITVERARPTFSNINGTAAASQGGTGRDTLTEDYVLVGNGTDPVKLIPIADSIANNNHLVPNNVVKAYVDSATAGLTGAMHFIGDAGVPITNNSSVDPRISGYNLASAQPGDVILYDQKEFVWTGAAWRLLGDEGSYAIKGSIKDADIDPDAEIQQSKIAGLADSFEGKVDKVEGKDLSTNDFTDEYKQKLDEIEEGAQRNLIEHILLNGDEVRPTTIDGTPNSVNLEVSEFDDASRQKLNDIEAEAQVNIIEKIIYDGEELTPSEGKVVTINPDPHTEHENKIEQIFINNVEWVPNQDKQVFISIDQAALNLNVLEGATIPDGHGGREDVDQAAKKLLLSRIAVTEDVSDLKQRANTYIILNCGSSTEVV